MPILYNEVGRRHMLNENNLRNALKELRIKKGLTEAQVAARLGKTGNSYVNRIENGPTKINIETIQELCSVYQIAPFELLKMSSTTHSAQESKKGFFERSSFRGNVLSDEARTKIKEILPTLRKIGEVRNLLGRDPLKLEDISTSLDRSKLQSAPVARKYAREIAGEVRTFFGISQNSSINVADFILSNFNISLCGLDLGEDCWGLFSIDKLNNPLIIYSNSHKYLQRNVFTIAHELGHYLFNHDQLAIDCDKDTSTLAEKVANSFAQELLVPLASLRAVYDEFGFSLVEELKPHHIVTLCEHFRVSFFMMLICLKEAQKINETQLEKLKNFCINELEQEGESLGYYPDTYLSKVKTLKIQLRDLVLIALRKQKISFFDASRLLDEPEFELKAAL